MYEELLPDAEITKLTKGQQLIKRMSENPNQFHLIFHGDRIF